MHTCSLDQNCSYCNRARLNNAVRDAVMAVINIDKSRELYRLYLETYARTEINTLSPISCNKDTDIATLLCQIIGQKDKWSRLPPRSWEALLAYLNEQVKGL